MVGVVPCMMVPFVVSRHFEVRFCWEIGSNPRIITSKSSQSVAFDIECHFAVVHILSSSSLSCGELLLHTHNGMSLV